MRAGGSGAGGSGSGTGSGFSRRIFLASGTALGLALSAGRALAAARTPGIVEADIANAEGVRAVKRLQHAFVHYAEDGDFAAMADLFATDGRLVYPPADVSGRAASETAWRNLMADGAPGLGPDRLNVRLMLAPVVTLAADGQGAKGRWHEFGLIGTYGKSASWLGGIHENDYVLEDGVWKIAALAFHPQFAGPYETGWRNIGATVPFVPYHYTLWQAASSPSTQAFLLIGTLVLLPIILMYTAWSYWVFRGKVREGIGYH